MARAIRDVIDINASAERVFACLTTPDELLRWWTSFDAPSTHFEFDARRGGRWSARWRLPDGREFEMGGEVVDIRPPTFLEVTWRDDRYPNLPATRVRYELADIPGGCRLQLIHDGFDDRRADFDDYNGGWRSVLGKLRWYVSQAGEFKGNRDVAIEVPDLPRARAFYTQALGFRVCSESDHVLELDAGSFRLWVKRGDEVRNFLPSLDAIDAARARSLVRAAGGRVIETGQAEAGGFVIEDPFGLRIDVVAPT